MKNVQNLFENVLYYLVLYFKFLDPNIIKIHTVPLYLFLCLLNYHLKIVKTDYDLLNLGVKTDSSKFG